MEPFPRCDMCGINIPTGRLIRNLRTARCGRNMQMRLRRRDVEITASFMGATFSLVGDDGADFFEGAESLNYLRRFLHQLDEDSLAVFQNVSRSKQVWGRLGKFLSSKVGSSHDSLSKVLLRSGPDGAPLWGGNRCFDGNNTSKN